MRDIGSFFKECIFTLPIHRLCMLNALFLTIFGSICMMTVNFEAFLIVAFGMVFLFIGVMIYLFDKKIIKEVQDE